MSLIPWRAGRQSDTYRTNQGLIVKQVRRVAAKDAPRLAQQWRREYERLRHYLGAFVLETHLFVGTGVGDDAATVIVIQPEVQGLSLAETIAAWRAGRLDIEPARAFLRCALQMEAETGMMPDAFGRFRLPWGYRPQTSRNVIVREINGRWEPLLVDTNFAWQSHTVVGRLLHRLLAANIRHLLRRIT